MPIRETHAHKIAVLMVSLRNARAGLALGPHPHDKSAVKARIVIYDELVSRLGEVDRNLRQLSSDAHRMQANEIQHRRAYRDDGSSSARSS